MGQVWQSIDRVAEGIIEDTGLGHVGIAPVCLEPGGKGAGHSHTEVEEINIFKSGTGTIQIENDIYDVCAGTVAIVKDGQYHEVRNTGDENLEYFAVFNTDVDRSKIRFFEGEEHFKSVKTAYVDILNKIAAGECCGAAAFTAWADKTPNAEFKGVLQTIAIREAEHSHAFIKRLCELGYEVDMSDVDPALVEQLDFLGTDASDIEKIECMGFDKVAEHDVFDGIFKDKTIDPITGGLLGRYIAEERDSARMVRECYQQMTKSSKPRKTSTSDSVTLEQVCEAVTSLTGLVKELQGEIAAIKPVSKAKNKPRASKKVNA